MNEAVAGYAFLAVDGSRLTFEVCDAAGRLPDHQISGRAIPRAEFQLPESVEATRGDVAQVQRRRTRSPHRLRAQGEFAKIIQVVLLAGPNVIWEPCGKKAGVEGGDF